MARPTPSQKLRRGVALILGAVFTTAIQPAPRAQQEEPEAPPTEAMLGVPVYPGSTFLTSYEAGLEQRYYLYGTQAGFEDMVRYYAVVLDDRGDRVFTAPPVHVFDTGRFDEDRMAFPPSVTIKDYTWNDSEGFLDPAGGRERYATIIQIVPPPAAESR